MHAYEMWNLQAPWEMDNQADKNSGFQTISYAARCSSDLQAKLNQDQRCQPRKGKRGFFAIGTTCAAMAFFVGVGGSAPRPGGASPFQAAPV